MRKTPGKTGHFSYFRPRWVGLLKIIWGGCNPHNPPPPESALAICSGASDFGYKNCRHLLIKDKLNYLYMVTWKMLALKCPVFLKVSLGYIQYYSTISSPPGFYTPACRYPVHRFSYWLHVTIAEYFVIDFVASSVLHCFYYMFVHRYEADFKENFLNKSNDHGYLPLFYAGEKRTKQNSSKVTFLLKKGAGK